MQRLTLIGKTFGLWTVLADDTPSRGRISLRFCRCACGTETEVRTGNLTAGISTNCGCVRNFKTTQRNLSHGHGPRKKRTPEYESWLSARHRCFDTKSPAYPSYGGRGITMCEEWKNSFKAFFRDMGPRPLETTLDRYPDKKGHYMPGNCRWATSKEQSRNRLDNHLVSFRGQIMTVSQLTQDHAVVGRSTVLYRLTHGWTVEKAALTRPLGFDTVDDLKER